jgi:MYXO-CTERM domain-containing protein
MLKKLTNIAMACTLALCLAAIGVAQTAGNNGTADNTGTGTTTSSTRATDNDRDHNYGWIGLAGLVGLAGLMRRDPDRARDRVHTGTATRT